MDNRDKNDQGQGASKQEAGRGGPSGAGSTSNRGQGTPAGPGSSQGGQQGRGMGGEQEKLPQGGQHAQQTQQRTQGQQPGRGAGSEQDGGDQNRSKMGKQDPSQPRDHHQ